jgi:hypothetical protein
MNRYDRNHWHYDVLIALRTTEGILTVRENLHHHDDLEDVWESSNRSYQRAIDEIMALCEKWLVEDPDVIQYSIVAINEDLCWKERLDQPVRG